VDDVVAHVVVGAEVRDLSSVLFLERREGGGVRVRGGEEVVLREGGDLDDIGIDVFAKFPIDNFIPDEVLADVLSVKGREGGREEREERGGKR
jgi:hypothetical protein